jgi:predicted transposase YbfD/YdcC
MAGKKGEIPLHVKKRKKQFSHPGIEHPLIKILEEAEDPREASLSFRYSLTSVFFMSLIAIICGATNWAKVVVMSQGMIDWMAQYVDMSGGVPCERTFKNIFNILKPEILEKSLQEVSSLIREKTPQEVINFDGQAKRGTADKQKRLGGIHLLNAWSADNRICLGQFRVDDKSNEIPAMPKLMDMLDLQGTIITADAMHTQKNTVKQAVKQEADYVLPVKENQSALLEEIRASFENLDKEVAQEKIKWERSIEKAQKNRDKKRLEKLSKMGIPTCGASYWKGEVEKLHGRIETRSCASTPVGNMPSKEGWEGLQSIARIQRERIEGDRVSNETIYYISSLQPNAAFIAETVKEHWGVENGLHWRLDVVFRQDKSRYRDRIGASNQAVIYKMALNALLQEDTLKKGVATKQCVAACNPTYRTKVLKKILGFS